MGLKTYFVDSSNFNYQTMKKNLSILVCFLVNLFFAELNAQNPILRSTTNSTPGLAGVTTSILTQNGNFIGIGTTTPSERLTLNFHQKIVNSNGMVLYTNVAPTIRFEFTSSSLPITTSYWHLVGGTSFSLFNPIANQTPIQVSSTGVVTFMPLVQFNGPSNIGNNNNFLGIDISSNSSRKIYWTSRLNGVDDMSVPLDFTFDARAAGSTDLTVLRLMPTGQVRIGAENTLYQNYMEAAAPNSNNSVRLSVKGNVVAQGFIATQQNWADFVFYAPENNPTLEDEERSIQDNCTLVGVPSEQEAALGRNLAENDALLLQKIEQLYLHVISLKKQMEFLESENAELKKMLNH